MFKVHPYEEVAYDLIPLANQNSTAGLGRIGHLEAPLVVSDYLEQVKQSLNTDSLRLVGDPSVQVKKIAVCGGSGAGLVQTAHRQGADLMVTGDVKYHEARQAEDLGIAVIDAGHFATEHLAINGLVDHLGRAAKERNWDMIFQAFSGETDPFRTM
jgi:putative NIF3 family GTP cyclohydrolase 1 type 2